MFNSGLRKEAQRDLEVAVENYEKKVETRQKKLEELYNSRTQLKTQLQYAIEYIDGLANKPVEINADMKEVKIQYTRFENLLIAARKQYDEDLKAAGGTVAGGVAAGVGVAALVPTAAMAIATTFGTASTGVAISTLSGAAATNAALAWLGGGAIAAGGSGMAGGSALLAAAGPIGWTIGGAALIGGGLLANGKNKKAAEKMRKQTVEIKAAEKGEDTLIYETARVIKLTNDDSDYIRIGLQAFTTSYPNNAQEFSNEQWKNIVAFVNNMKASAKRLNWGLGEDRKFHAQD